MVIKGYFANRSSKTGVFAAAIALLIIGFGLTKLPDILMESKEPVVAQKVQTEIKKKTIEKALPLARKDSPVRAQKPSDRRAEKAVEVQEKQAGVSSQPVAQLRDRARLLFWWKEFSESSLTVKRMWMKCLS